LKIGSILLLLIDRRFSAANLHFLKLLLVAFCISKNYGEMSISNSPVIFWPRVKYTGVFMDASNIIF